MSKNKPILSDHKALERASEDRCPFCGSVYVQYDRLYLNEDGETVGRPAQCITCSEDWTQEYNLDCIVRYDND